MSSSFTVTVQQHGDGRLLAQLSRARPNVPDGIILRDIVLGPLPATFQRREELVDYGRQIHAALLSHPAIGQAIRQVYNDGAEPPKLMFEIMVPSAESYRWEALCNDEQRFAAIQLGCRVARVANNAGAPEHGTLPFTWPVRMSAFMSAAGLPAREEMDQLIVNLERNQGENPKIECTFYLGEQGLIDDLQARIAAGLRGVQVKAIPPTAEDLEDELTVNPPHLLHFFCHGRSRAGAQYLEFATINDWDQGNAAGSSRLSLDRLVRLPNLNHSWLTTLNCCEGAGAVDQTYSQAFQLVAVGGCPNAVGMNEPISPDDATTFSRSFYRSLFAILRDKLTAGGAPIALDFTPAIVAARRALHDAYELQPPEAFSRWTLPVLYVSRDGLKVQLFAPRDRILVDEATQSRIDTVARFLREQPADAPDEVRDRALAILDQAPPVPPALRPDRLGNFPG